MKKLLLFLFILLSLFQAKASDTLTVRQVFNFNVGDTFDYSQVTSLPNLGFFQTSYLRKVLIQKNYSTGMDTLYLSFILPIGSTTEIDTITNLDSIAIYNEPAIPTIDTSQCLTSPFNYANTIYWGFPSDSLNVGCFENANSYRYTKKLGRTYYDSRVFDGGGPDNNAIDTYTEKLIYFANDSIHLGISYYILAEVNDINYSSNISLFPSPTLSQLHLSFSNAKQYNAQFILTNILGQEVYTSLITQDETTLDISKLSSGIYTWRIISENNIIKTGKIVKE